MTTHDTKHDPHPAQSGTTGQQPAPDPHLTAAPANPQSSLHPASAHHPVAGHPESVPKSAPAADDASVPVTAAKDKSGKPMDDGNQSGGKTVDDPPGKQGYQGVSPDAVTPPVPDWKEGENPPGTNPPKAAAHDPATTLPPGTNPVFNADDIGAKKAGGSEAPKPGPGDPLHPTTPHGGHPDHNVPGGAKVTVEKSASVEVKKDTGP